MACRWTAGARREPRREGTDDTGRDIDALDRTVGADEQVSAVRATGIDGEASDLGTEWNRARHEARRNDGLGGNTCHQKARSNGSGEQRTRHGSSLEKE